MSRYEPLFAVPVAETRKGYYDPVTHQQTASLSTSQNSPANLRVDHIRRLTDIVHLCLQRRDLVRAQKAWAVLARCHEINLAAAGWSTLAREFDVGSQRIKAKGLDALRERVLACIDAGQEAEGLDDLETQVIGKFSLPYMRAETVLNRYITAHPYSEDASLHVYAGMLALFLAQPTGQPAKRRARESSASSVSSADAEPGSQRQPTSSQGKLVGLKPVLASSARGYFRRALLLYRAGGQKDSPASSFVKTMLTMVSLWLFARRTSAYLERAAAWARI